MLNLRLDSEYSIRLKPLDELKGHGIKGVEPFPPNGTSYFLYILGITVKFL